MKQIIYHSNISILYLILLLIVWSILFPNKRIWPPPSIKSWQFQVYWSLFTVSVVFDVYLIYANWNTWIIDNAIRYYIGIPLTVIGSVISLSSIYTLGITNTSGLKGGFTASQLYKFTRNPQYIGDIILLIGLLLFVNSIPTTIVLLLTIFSFILMPFPEEIWLEKEYGDIYLKYKNNTSRFL